MLQDLDFLVEQGQEESSTDNADFYTRTAKVMMDVYEKVRIQQKRISDKNVEARMTRAVDVK